MWSQKTGGLVAITIYRSIIFLKANQMQYVRINSNDSIFKLIKSDIWHCFYMLKNSSNDTKSNVLNVSICMYAFFFHQTNNS